MNTPSQATQIPRPSRALRVIAGLIAVVFGFALSALVVEVLGAQVPRSHPSSDPAAVALFERHYRETGSDRPPPFQHAVVETTMTGGPTTRVETFNARPNKVLVRSYSGDDLLMEFGFDGTEGWSKSPMTGLVKLEGQMLDAMRAGVNAVTTPEVDSTVRLTSLGRGEFEGAAVERVRLVTAKGDTAEMFFAVASGLMVGARSSALADLPVGAGPIEIALRDYRRIGDRMVSMTQVMRMNEVEVVARTLALDYEPIPPDRFRPPPAP